MASSIFRGGIYEVDWSPARGSEQAGMRPALVIQNDIGNSVEAYRLTIVLAMSSKLKGYPSMVLVQPTQSNGLTAPSEINSGQILTVDKARLGRLIGRLAADDLRKVEDKVVYMLGVGG